LVALKYIKLFTRAPFMSYASPKTYVAGTAITSLSPTGRLVAAPGYSSRTTKLGSGFNSPEGVGVDARGDLFMADDRNISYTTSATAACPSFAKKNHGYDFTQFYSVAFHTTSANYVVDWTQDNGAQQFTSTAMNPTDYLTGGNGANTFIDQAKGNIPRTSYVYNNLGGGSYFNYGYPSVFETKNTTTATPVWTLVEGNLPRYARWPGLVLPGHKHQSNNCH